MSITKTKKPTQKKLIADHIKKVGSISGLEALSLYRVMDLPKVMSDLIKQGLGIRKEYKKDNTGVRYIRYYFSDEDAREQLGKEVYSGNLFSMS